MLQFTPQQSNELLTIISRNQALVVGREFGLDFLTDYDKQLLENYGVNVNELYTEADDTIFTSFHYGLLSDSLAELGKIDQINYNDLQQYISSGQYIPLTQYEQAVITNIKTQCLSSIKGIGNKIFNDVTGYVQNNSRQAQEEFLKKEIAEGVAKKQTVANIANEIAHKTGDWSRDFDRIVEYTSQTAFEQGKAAAIERQQGGEAEVYKRVFESACKHCVRLYLTDGVGSQPKIFKLSELRANGSNIGRKVDEWKPTVDSTHPYCYDNQTEVLTNSGWKLFKDLNKTELFFSVNLQTGEGEWVKAINWINQFYKGKMHHFTNKNFHLITTPNHHHVIKTYNSQKLRLVETNKLPNSSQFLTHLPKWSGVKKDHFTFDSKQFEANSFIQFLGFFISEGCLIDYKGQKRLHLSQSFEKYYEDIYKCLIKVFGKAIRCKGYLQVNLLSNQIELLEFLSFGKSFEKYVPEQVKECSSKQIEIFLAAYCKGDGSIYKGREWDGYKCNDYRLYYTSSKRIADDISELILKIGKRPSFKVKAAKEIYDPKRQKSYMQNHDIIVISELTNKFAYKSTMTETIVDYSGMIYDVELEKNHTLFIKRGGRVCVSGNCRCALINKPVGYDWNKETQAFDIYNEKNRPQLKRERKKIKATIGGVEVWI